jgi:hypothetical protein
MTASLPGSEQSLYLTLDEEFFGFDVLSQLSRLLIVGGAGSGSNVQG